MGMAHNAPMTGDPRRYISNHAIERLRDRASPGGHVDDASLIRLLDDAVHEALKEPTRVETFTDRDGQAAKSVRLDLHDVVLEGEVYAVVKANREGCSRYREGGRDEAVVTVLPRPPRSAKGSNKEPFHTGLQALSGLRDELPAEPVELEPAYEPEKPPVDTGRGDNYLVMVDGKVVSDELSKEDANKIIVDSVGSACRVFREVPVRVKVEVDWGD